MSRQGFDQQGGRPALRRLGPPPRPAVARPPAPEPEPEPVYYAPEPEPAPVYQARQAAPQREVYHARWVDELDELDEPEPPAPEYQSAAPEPASLPPSNRSGDTDELDPSTVMRPAGPVVRQAPPAEEKKDSNALMLGAGCVLMMVAGIVIATVLGMNMVRERAAQRQPQQPGTAAAVAPLSTPTAESTEAPTPTPSPTPIPSIRPTPLPTWTPMPGSGSSQTVIDYRGKDAQYKTDMTRIGDFVQGTLTTVNDMLKNPQPQDDHWAYQLGTQIGPWKEFYQEVSTVEPPTRYQTANANLVKALQRLDSAADDLIYGVDNNDPATIKSAQDKIAQGTQLLADAMSSLKSTA